MDMSHIIYGAFLVLPFIVFMAAVFDLYTYTIPNSLSIFLVLGFYLFAFLNPNLTFSDVMWHSLIGFGALIFCFTLFCFGVFGGGDAKILAASSLWIGINDIIPYFVYVSMAGGVLSIFVMWFRGHPCYPIFLKLDWLKSLYFGTEHKRSVPYAIAIALGLYIFLPETRIFHLSIVS